MTDDGRVSSARSDVAKTVAGALRDPRPGVRRLEEFTKHTKDTKVTKEEGSED
jgi:hypothetical protein